jgi:hypothetical protein
MYIQLVGSVAFVVKDWAKQRAEVGGGCRRLGAQSAAAVQHGTGRPLLALCSEHIASPLKTLATEKNKL